MAGVGSSSAYQEMIADQNDEVKHEIKTNAVVLFPNVVEEYLRKIEIDQCSADEEDAFVVITQQDSRESKKYRAFIIFYENRDDNLDENGNRFRQIDPDYSKPRVLAQITLTPASSSYEALIELLRFTERALKTGDDYPRDRTHVCHPMSEVEREDLEFLGEDPQPE